MRRIRSVAAAVIVIAAAFTAAAPAQAAASHKIKGTLTNTSLVVTSDVVSGNHEVIDAYGSASVDGTAVGTLDYTLHLTINTVSHHGRGVIDQTFTGSVGTLGSGTISLHGILLTRGDAFRVNDRVTGGTDAFAGAAGTVKLAGTLDITTGVGSGAYRGHVVL